MARQPNWPPRITRHPSGQARVTCKGKSHYLGVFGSPEAQSAYARLLVELSTGAPSAASNPGDRVGHLVTQYLAWLASEPDTSTRRKLRNVARSILRLMADVPVSAFGARHLETLRSSWLGGIGCERQGVGVANTNANRARAIFRWAEIRGLAPEGVYARLLALPPLRGGQGQAVGPVSWECLCQTLPYLEPTPATICALGWWTAMRPKELCSLRAEYVDLSAGWIALEAHKTSAKTGAHRLPIGPESARILGPQLQIRPAGYLFPSPSAAGHYSPTSLSRAIARACAAHGIPHWHPYQLRHAAKERIAQTCGIEAARVILRHTSLGMTSRYASRIDPVFAAEVARKCG